LTTLGVTELVVVGFKVAVPLLLGLVVGTPSRSGSVLAGVSKDELEKSAAGMKLISETQPSWVGANFRRLCDLRSREVCLYRAPVISRDWPLIENQVGTWWTARPCAQSAVNLS